MIRVNKEQTMDNKGFIQAFKRLGYKSKDLTVCEKCECVVPKDKIVKDNVCVMCVNEEDNQ